jgi:uncharacterized protein (DUF1810 family)
MPPTSDLGRFVTEQDTTYRDVVTELTRGKKTIDQYFEGAAIRLTMHLLEDGEKKPSDQFMEPFSASPGFHLVEIHT